MIYLSSLSDYSPKSQAVLRRRTYGSGPKLLIAANHRHATVMVAPITPGAKPLRELAGNLLRVVIRALQRSVGDKAQPRVEGEIDDLRTMNP